MTTFTKLKPFVKWAGGKRGLLHELLARLPDKFNNYFEPFVGGGALFFELKRLGLLENKTVYLLDKNAELINTYQVIKNYPNDLIQALAQFQENHSKEFYYGIRALDRNTDFKSLDSIYRAARFIYLNKTCFNGLYRVNSKGFFNVPIGSYTNPCICDAETITITSEALQQVEIIHSCYSSILRFAKKDDFIYFDPPYYPLNATSNFTAYGKDAFLEAEQIALFETFKTLDSTGCFVMHSNSNSEFIKTLYHDYPIEFVEMERFINSKANGRAKIKEVIFRNYSDVKTGDFMKLCNFETLHSTFQDSIFTWSYFTDFDKVKNNIKAVEKELNLLNYLIGKSDIETEFLNLVREYPKVRQVLPLLIAARIEKLKNMPVITNMESLISRDKSYIFDSEQIDEEELITFFRHSGLKNIFQDRNVKNLVDYCFGVEVGMDTNARKNRTGKLMENLVHGYLKSFCQNHKDFRLIEQATSEKLERYFGLNISLDKRFSFALFNAQTKQIFLIEANYYSRSGSKMKATAGEYKDLNDLLKKQNAIFIWITDGQGWLTALRPLEETFNHNDYVINLSMLQNGILSKILNVA